MNATTRLLIPALAISAVVLPACGSLSFVIGEEGSGVPETTTYDFESFDEFKVGNAFEAEIELADGPPTVAVTVDDNFTDDLKVRVEDGRLEVKLDLNSFRTEIQPTVVVTVPSLSYIDASGASQVAVDGVLSESKLILDASGASEIVVDVDTDVLTIDASGASTINASGTADQLSLEASGASRIDLDDIVANTGTVDASGASRIEIGDAADIDGDLSGASSLSAPADAIDQIDSSGASEINRR